MLKKKERLSRDAFNRFFSVGKRYHVPLFQLIYAPHTSFHTAVVVSKKIEKLAVERNRLRRRVYDCVRRRRVDLGTGVYILIAKQPARRAPYTLIKESVTELIKQTTKVR